jgi:hypothetical protein
LRVFGAGSGGIDRVRIPLTSGATARPVDIGAGDITIELWLRGTLAENTASGCSTANDAWITGNVVVDRDVYGAGDHGDWGISLFDGRVAFGASRGSSGATVCGSTNVLDGAWHHVAVTRRESDGRLQIWVDGALDGTVATSPATGDISYREGRSTTWPADPFLVLGAEKHDAGAAYPSFSGWIDEVRLSTVRRYTAPFTRPTGPFVLDAATAALYHCDEGTGTVVGDARGSSPGELRLGGTPVGPVWSADEPW